MISGKQLELLMGTAHHVVANPDKTHFNEKLLWSHYQHYSNWFYKDRSAGASIDEVENISLMHLTIGLFIKIVPYLSWWRMKSVEL